MANHLGEFVQVHLAAGGDAAAATGRLDGGLGDALAAQVVQGGGGLGYAQGIIGVVVAAVEGAFDVRVGGHVLQQRYCQME